MMNKSLLALTCFTITVNCFAVSSQIVRHKTAADIAKAETENVVISSRGTIQLSRDATILSEGFGDSWLINSIVCADDGSIYAGTSPNGGIYKYSKGNVEQIYPAEKPIDLLADSNDPNVQNESHTANMHIFKMATDSTGRLIAGISGQNCSLIRYTGNGFETIFTPDANDASYIFDIVLDKKGNIFLGTGPNGKIFKLNSNGNKAETVYTCKDKNVMALATGNGNTIYAGTDTRGVIYKIDTNKKNASILYDSNQDEISDLIFDDQGYLYAAATSYKSIKAQLNNTNNIQQSMPGRPEPSNETTPMLSSDSNKVTLTIPNSTPPENKSKTTPLPPSLFRNTAPDSSSVIYKIDERGFVEKVFSETAVFFCIKKRGNILTLGTGNKAQLYTIDTDTETETLSYEDKTASQITDIVQISNMTYIATANPSKLIRISNSFADNGSFESPLIDAAQPASWGKLQIDAEIPAGTQIMLSARSGNVSEANDPTFSQWTTPERITKPRELNVPLGRFCQYKLILKGNKKATPIIRQTATAFMIPNRSPKVKSINVAAVDKTANKGILKISYNAEDENADSLQYKIEFRRADRLSWIKLKDEITDSSYNWDSRTVEDGIYEVMVTASDIKSNTQQTELLGTRISEPVIVDNTAPAIIKQNIKVLNDSATIELQVKDELSVIKSVSYTLDSNKDFIPTLPNDSIYDTLEEYFLMTLEKLSKGSHVLAVKIIDVEENTIYKTFDIDIH